MTRDLSKFLEEVRFVVPPEDADLRLDHFVVDKIFWRSRRDLQDRIRKGRILLRGAHSKPSARLRAGDEVIVLVSPSDLPDQDPGSIDLSLLLENDQVIVLNKQPGVLVHPTGRHVYDTLMNALHLRFRDQGQREEIHVVHRLDRNTSGVLVFARNLQAKQALQHAFETAHPRKEYLAVVDGLMASDRGTIEEPIGPDDKAEIRLKMCVRPDGLPSRTHWQVEERFDAHTLVRVRIETGRQHQIRVHLRHLGHPVLCDPLYGDPRSVGAPGEEPVLERQALHAELLEMDLPGREGTTQCRAPLHRDMEDVIALLRAGVALRAGRDIQSARWRRA